MPTDPITTGLILTGGRKASAWFWDKFGKIVTDRAVGQLKGAFDKFKWDAAAEKYRKNVIRLYGTMQVMGMREPVPLEDIFADTYILDKTTATRRFNIEQLKQIATTPDVPPPNAKRINGLQLVVEKNNLFILGKPGAGKSTFLKYIALKAAEGLIGTEQGINKVPILIWLNDWAKSAKDLSSFIVEQFDICGFPDATAFVNELLASGNAIVLFDGLDEVNQESGQRDRQIQQMRNFIRKYDDTQCLITCRIAANDYTFEPFTYVEVADFTSKQAEKFICNWFRHKSEIAQKFLTAFGQSENRGLRDLARTPLLLTLICLAFEDTMSFPQRRVEMYEDAINALLHRWDSTRGIKRDEVYRKLSLGHKRQMFARLASITFGRGDYFMLSSEWGKLIDDYLMNVPPHNEADEVEGEVILRSIESQHGILVARSKDYYSFSHLTFQEYFAAKYIVENAASGTLAALLLHCGDSRWREVTLLATSLLSNATNFLSEFRATLDSFLDDAEISQIFLWVSEKVGLVRGNQSLARRVYLNMVEVDSVLETHGTYTYYKVDADRGVRAKSVRDAELFNARERALSFPTASIDSKLLALDQILSEILDNGVALSVKGMRRRGFHKTDEMYESILNGRQTVCSLAKELELNTLAVEIISVVPPTIECQDEEWEGFVLDLRRLLLKHRDIGHIWLLAPKKLRKLKKYFFACSLLKDCLDLATMPPKDRSKIEESLFLPASVYLAD